MSVRKRLIQLMKSKKATLEKAAQDLATRVYQQQAQNNQNNQNNQGGNDTNGKDDNVVDADYSDVN